MKILYDYQIFSLQRYGGVSKYFAEVIRRLPENSWILKPLFSDNEYLSFYNLIEQNNFPVSCNFKWKSRLLKELGKFQAIKDLRKCQFDVFHQTDFDPYAIKYLGNKPFITTFHDANYLNGNNPRPRFVKYLSESLNRSDAIITISNNTKNDLLHYYPHLYSKNIKVIYHGIDEPYYLTERRLLDSEYILYVGGRQKYKNFKTFVKAFSAIAPLYKGLKVVCTMTFFTKDEIDLFQKLGVSDRMIAMKVNEEELNRLYRDAILFIYPSMYEGFGMPILEAMINRCPVILSEASCFPEIAQDAALYFKPQEADELASKMNIIIDSQEVRKKLVEKGLSRVSEFSWDKTAKQHIELYKQFC